MEDAIRRALRAEPDIAFAYLYGSVARHRSRPSSDVDVAVHLTRAGEEAKGRSTDWDRWSELQATLGRVLPDRDVDLVLLEDAPPLLADRIATHGRVLVSNDEVLRVRWVARTKSRYCDLAPLHRLLDESMERRARAGTFGRPWSTPR